MHDHVKTIAHEAVQLIANQPTLADVERLMGLILTNSGVTSYKLVWLDERGLETSWMENGYHYQFQTRKEFVHFHDKNILILYYNTENELAGILATLKTLTIYAYLTIAYSTKNERHYMRQDLELAAKMQQMLVPKNLYCNKSFCASGLYIPNYKVGGDFYDVIPINEHKIGFCIGDISGKGINAAIIMAHFTGFIRSTLIQDLKLEETIQLINSKMYELTHGEKFITLFLAVYNTQDKRLIYINSGHVAIPIYDAESIQWLETGTTILGMFKELPFIELGKVHLDAKKQLLLYTDGLLNLNIDHEPFLSSHELSYILNHECLGKYPHEITNYFQEKVKGINVDEDLKDDISVLAVELG